jgi:hypothetical protein
MECVAHDGLLNTGLANWEAAGSATDSSLVLAAIRSAAVDTYVTSSLLYSNVIHRIFLRLSPK